jgi:aconitase A
VRLAGVEAIVAEGFERIHRTNLVGMGVLPLQFRDGDTRHTYGIDGTETFDVDRRGGAGGTLTVMMQRNGEQVEIPATCRLDRRGAGVPAGGVLQRFAQDFLAAA